MNKTAPAGKLQFVDRQRYAAAAAEALFNPGDSSTLLFSQRPVKAQRRGVDAAGQFLGPLSEADQRLRGLLQFAGKLLLGDAPRSLNRPKLG